jgi:hypothetical protein
MRGLGRAALLGWTSMMVSRMAASKDHPVSAGVCSAAATSRMRSATWPFAASACCTNIHRSCTCRRDGPSPASAGHPPAPLRTRHKPCQPAASHNAHDEAGDPRGLSAHSPLMQDEGPSQRPAAAAQGAEAAPSRRPPRQSKTPRRRRRLAGSRARAYPPARPWCGPPQPPAQPQPWRPPTRPAAKAWPGISHLERLTLPHPLTHTTHPST